MYGGPGIDDKPPQTRSVAKMVYPHQCNLQVITVYMYIVKCNENSVQKELLHATVAMYTACTCMDHNNNIIMAVDLNMIVLRLVIS